VSDLEGLHFPNGCLLNLSVCGGMCGWDEEERGAWLEVGIRLNLLHVRGLPGGLWRKGQDRFASPSGSLAKFSVGFLGCDSLLPPRLP
jgi:hypothetical protein